MIGIDGNVLLRVLLGDDAAQAEDAGSQKPATAHRPAALHSPTRRRGVHSLTLPAAFILEAQRDLTARFYPLSEALVKGSSGKIEGGLSATALCAAAGAVGTDSL